MPVMLWTAKMSVGVPELDEDHKQLIAVINRLAAVSGPEARRDIVRRCLFALMRYAESHFAREEKVMAACGYPDLGGHGEEHRAFVRQLQVITRNFNGAPNDLAAHVNDELLDFLKDWLYHHILIEDMGYRPYAERRITKAREAAKSFRAAELWRGG